MEKQNKVRNSTEQEETVMDRTCISYRNMHRPKHPKSAFRQHEFNNVTTSCNLTGTSVLHVMRKIMYQKSEKDL